MINLRDSKYATEFVTKEKLFEIISDYDVFNYYIENFEIGKLIWSPLREEKNKPSFNVFWSRKNNCLMFKDLGNGCRGDAIMFVSHLFQISYIDALRRIANDFSLGHIFILEEGYEPVKKPILLDKGIIGTKIANSVELRVRTREWRECDKKYWTQFGITKSTLIKYNVFPIDYIFLNGHIIKADELAYAYVEYKDGEDRYKIYQPFSKDMKWINNFIEGTISGFAQLPAVDGLLVISSSLKDGMCLHDLLGVNFLAPQTENYIFKKHIIDNLKERFDKIIVFYDNDDAGRRASNMMYEQFGLPSVNTGSILKDPSDLYKF